MTDENEKKFEIRSSETFLSLQDRECFVEVYKRIYEDGYTIYRTEVFTKFLNKEGIEKKFSGILHGDILPAIQMLQEAYHAIKYDKEKAIKNQEKNFPIR